MKIERNIDAVFRPGEADGERAVWLVDERSTPLCEVPESDAVSLVLELAELLGLFVCRREALSEAAE
ncbi:hypothetical protein OHB39_05445 [Streptomyces sp. NBC_00047]|uniref:hypothetical protein n=1 Tax=Streptomyces sp. NBC_00047 TaxID=2975627 RepID=UPI002252912E|nr:hypothetical protein [Streptomyces sp. NBC_00047]MCX5607026.1 hypothetical protein [Streptomyces sp. NBC_00047]